MARRDNHYEAAFEDYLRCRGWPYVAVDETKRTIFADAKIKSFDFLVYSSAAANLLVDVKGRKFPDGVQGARRGGKAWENWVTREDVEGLTEWEKVFGAGFQAMLVFAYWLQGPPQRSPFADVHLFRKRHYAFAGLTMAEYVAAAKPRSVRWHTLAMPGGELARRAKDVAAFL